MNIVENLSYSLPSLVLNERNMLPPSTSAPSAFLEKCYMPIYQDQNRIVFQIIGNGFLDPHSTLVEFDIIFLSTGYFKVDNSFLNIFKKLKISVDGKDIEEFENMDNILTIISDVSIENEKRKSLRHIGFDSVIFKDEIYNGSNSYIHYVKNERETGLKLNEYSYQENKTYVKNGIPFTHNMNNNQKEFQKLRIKLPLTSQIFGILNPKKDFLPLFLCRTIEIELEINHKAFRIANNFTSHINKIDQETKQNLELTLKNRIFDNFGINFFLFPENNGVTNMLKFLKLKYKEIVKKEAVFPDEKNLLFRREFLACKDRALLTAFLNKQSRDYDINDQNMYNLLSKLSDIINIQNASADFILSSIKKFEELFDFKIQEHFKNYFELYEQLYMCENLIEQLDPVAKTSYIKKIKSNTLYPVDLTEAKSKGTLFIIDSSNIRLKTTQLFFDPAFHNSLQNGTQSYKLNTKFFHSKVMPLNNNNEPNLSILFNMPFSSINYLGTAFFKKIEPEDFYSMKNFRFSNNVKSVQFSVNNLNFPELPVTGNSGNSFGDDQNIDFIHSLRKAFNIRMDKSVGVINQKNFAINLDTTNGEYIKLFDFTNYTMLNTENNEIIGKSAYIINTGIAPAEDGKLTGINCKKFGNIACRLDFGKDIKIHYENGKMYQLIFCQYDATIELTRDYPIILN